MDDKEFNGYYCDQPMSYPVYRWIKSLESDCDSLRQRLEQSQASEAALRRALERARNVVAGIWQVTNGPNLKYIKDTVNRIAGEHRKEIDAVLKLPNGRVSPLLTSPSSWRNEWKRRN